MFLTSPNLPLPHGFFTRKGGVSEGLYASLNCGLGSQDAREHVIENRSRVAHALGTTEERLCTLYQIHSPQVVTVDTPWARDALPQADAMVTNRRQIALGALAADCVPVLFADTQAGVIAAAHSGWKGAIAGVLGETVRAMCALGATPSSIRAAIGPCIAQASYEVGDEFYQNFHREKTENSRFFVSSATSGHWRFDIRGYVQEKLRQAGLHHINTLENNTYSEEDSFFSFRRATHRNEKDYGRQISAIMLT